MKPSRARKSFSCVPARMPSYSNSLDRRAATGALSKAPATQIELDRRVETARVLLRDAGIASLSMHSRFGLACEAARGLALAALRWHGYRPSNAEIMFELLPQMLGLSDA